MSHRTSIVAKQARFFQSARQDPQKRFNDVLYGIDRPDWIAAVIEQVLGAQGANTPGVDGKTAADYQTPFQKQELQEDIREFLHGSYFLPEKMRPVRIEKRKKSGYRTIFVPTLKDRMIGHLGRIPMEAIFEADLSPFSHGYRLKRCPMDSIFDCQRFLVPDRLWVLRADIRDCFASLNRERLLVLVEKRIADHKMVDLIGGFLDAEACDRDYEIDLEEGIPAGWPMSPLLMNIYLNELDQWWMQSGHPHLARTTGDAVKLPTWGLTRYADNLLFVARSKQEAEIIRDELCEYTSCQLGLGLSEAEIFHASGSFDFLGFQLQWVPESPGNGHLRVRASSERVQRLKRQIKSLLKNSSDPTYTISRINQLVMIFGSQFRYVDSKPQSRSLDHWIETQLSVWQHPQAIAGLALGNGPQTGSNLPSVKKLASTSRQVFKPFRGNPFV